MIKGFLIAAMASSAAASALGQNLGFQAGGDAPRFGSTASTSDPFSSIVRGNITARHPTVGALLSLSEDGMIDSACSGTLVGCRWFVTAGHCIDHQQPERLRVFLPNAGFRIVAQAQAPKRFRACQPEERDVCPKGDIGLVELSKDVDGIAPVPITRTYPVNLGDAGSIVGFGSTGSGRADFGIKRVGPAAVGVCSGQVPGADDVDWLCWRFSAGATATNCFGDSGGAYVASNGALGGVTSGGLPGAATATTARPGACDVNAIAFDTRVRSYAAWLDEASRHGLGSASCGSGPASGPAPDSKQIVNDGYRPGDAPVSHKVVVDPGAASLELSLSGTGDDFRNIGGVTLAAISPGGSGFDPRCAAEVHGNFAFCSIRDPEPGEWHAVVAFAADRPTPAPFVYQVILTETKRTP